MNLKIFILSILSLFIYPSYGQDKFDYEKDFQKLSKASKKEGKYNFEFLLNRFLQNDTSLTNYDILALLIGYTQTDNYKPYFDIEIEEGIYCLNDNGRKNAAIELANSFQKRNPVSLLMNLEKSYSYHKLGIEDSSKVYYYRYDQLIRAIKFSGNGKETPYFVLGPKDGQTMIKRKWGNEVIGMGSAYDKNDNLIDILTMRDSKMDSITVLRFHVDHTAESIFSSDKKKK